jgi:hypothetical protein
MEVISAFFFMVLGVLLLVGVGVLSDKLFRKDKNYSKPANGLELIFVGLGVLLVLFFVFYLAS